MKRRKQSHQEALDRIAELEAQNRQLDERIEAIQNLPPAVAADGVDDAELRSYVASKTVQAIIDQRNAATQAEHPLSGGKRKPERYVPVLDDDYFAERERVEARLRGPIGFGYAVASAGYYSASALRGGTYSSW